MYVTGVLSVEFEDEALYLSVDHYQRAIIDNAVQLDIPKELAELLRPLQGKYVTVFGTLRSTRASQYRTAFMISRIERIVSAGVGGGGR